MNFKKIEDLKPGEIVYRVHQDGYVSKMTVTAIKPEEYLIYFIDSLYNQDCYGVIKIHKTYMRLSGTNDCVYTSKEEAIQHLEGKIRYIRNQIEKLNKI